MTVRWLFSHFRDNTQVEIYRDYTEQRNNIKTWNGLISDDMEIFKGRKVEDWVVSEQGVLVIILKNKK